MHKPSILGQNHHNAIRKRVIEYLSMQDRNRSRKSDEKAYFADQDVSRKRTACSRRECFPTLDFIARRGVKYALEFFNYLTVLNDGKQCWSLVHA